MKKRIALLLLVVSFSLSCSDGSQLDLEQASFYLKRAANCADVERVIRDNAIAQMTAAIDSEMEQFLERWDCDDLRYGGEAVNDSAEYDADGGVPPSTESKGAKDYTTTNNQVLGVDEADFVKNDGSFIYILASGAFQIVDAWPAEGAAKLSEFTIEGEPKRMFVHKDRAVIYSSLGAITTNDPSFRQYYGGECTHGYDCDFTGDGHKLKMTVLDISDKNEPLLLRETVFNSSYLGSRRIGDAVFTMTVSPKPEIRFDWERWPDELKEYRWDCREEIPFSDIQIRTYFQRLKTKNVERFEGVDITDIIPTIEDKIAGQTEVGAAGDREEQCRNVYLSEDRDGTNIMTLVSFDPAENKPFDTTSIIGAPGAIYASGESLYVAARHRREQMGDYWYFDNDDSQATTIHKFDLNVSDHSTVYVASGIVKGHLLNQFSMDEYDGHLRIATTSGHVPDPDVHSTVSILAQSKGDLKLVGQVDNIAPTEDIRSARFNGAVGFIVTFKKTDPLFVLNLENPTKPYIEGELKIPGFSTYMHLMDDHHLLTIGYDADDQGDFAWFLGIQLQIIDVSDYSNPRLLHKEVIGTRGSSSEAATNHLAFTYFKNRNWLAIPMTVCDESSGGGGYGYNMTFSGLLVYETTVEDGFTSLGGVPHAEPTSGDDYYSTCGNWWTDSNTQVKRSIFMEDYVYSIALDKINVASVDDLANPVSEISLAE